MLPSMHPCVSPHAAAIERTYCVPWSSLPPPPLPSSPPRACVQDHRCSQRSSWRRTAGKRREQGRWSCDRTSCYGAQVSGWSWVSSAPLAAAELAFYRDDPVGTWSTRHIIWMEQPCRRCVFPATSVDLGAADGGDAAQCAQTDVCASCHPVLPVVRVAPPGARFRGGQRRPSLLHGLSIEEELTVSQSKCHPCL